MTLRRASAGDQPDQKRDVVADTAAGELVDSGDQTVDYALGGHRFARAFAALAQNSGDPVHFEQVPARGTDFG